VAATATAVALAFAAAVTTIAVLAPKARDVREPVWCGRQRRRHRTGGAGARCGDRRSPAAQHTAAAEIAEDGRMRVNFAHRQLPHWLNRAPSRTHARRSRSAASGAAMSALLLFARDDATTFW
jgi:hypothetical protein